MSSTKKILKKLKTVREEKFLSQKAIAERMGIDRTTYIRKEKGIIPITTEEWLKLADVLDKEVVYFFRFNDADSQVAEEKERLLARLFRLLSFEEKDALLACLRLLLKGIKRKKVRDTLEILTLR